MVGSGEGDVAGGAVDAAEHRALGALRARQPQNDAGLRRTPQRLDDDANAILLIR